MTIRMDLLILILLMTLVTYIPRAIPFALKEKIHISAGVERFLNLIPYTAMAALIYPGILSADSSHPMIGICGGLAAVIASLLKAPVIISVLAAAAVDLLLYLTVIPL